MAHTYVIGHRLFPHLKTPIPLYKAYNLHRQVLVFFFFSTIRFIKNFSFENLNTQIFYFTLTDDR